MNKKEVLKNITKHLSKDLMNTFKGVVCFIGIGSCVLYVMTTIFMGLIWWSTSVSSAWLKVWEPWAVSLAPYWTVGNLILAFISWIGYRTYQAVKNQK